MAFFHVRAAAVQFSLMRCKMTVEQQKRVPLEFSELAGENLPELFENNRKEVEQVVTWVHKYLCKPHPELGRPGPVCPFVPAALEKKLMYMNIYPDTYVTREALHELLLAELKWFLDMEPTSGNNAQFKTILILFPNIPVEEARHIVEMAQTDLRFKFTRKGLMVGEFHPGPPDKRGLWNKEFRPLYCPVPMVAIRHMVPTDILFLKDEHLLVTEYLRHFGDVVPTRFRKYIEEAAERFGFDLPENHPGRSSAPTVIYYLQKNQVNYKIHRHSQYDEKIRCPKDFADALGYDISRITKALLLRIQEDRKQFAIAVLPAMARADLKKIAEAMGVGRMEMANEEELKENVGHPRFAVTPIGVEGIPTFIDASLMEHETIFTGAGITEMEIEIAPGDMQKISGAVVLPFAE